MAVIDRQQDTKSGECTFLPTRTLFRISVFQISFGLQIISRGLRERSQLMSTTFRQFFPPAPPPCQISATFAVPPPHS